MTEEMELICFQLIANSGASKSSFVEAIHAELIHKEASGDNTEFSLLFMHAEDQMASTEFVKLLAQELIELYRDKHAQ